MSLRFSRPLAAVMVTCVIAIIGFSAITVRSSESDELRERAEMLLQKAKNLTEAGRVKEAAETERSAQKLMQLADKVAPVEDHLDRKRVEKGPKSVDSSTDSDSFRKGSINPETRDLKEARESEQVMKQIKHLHVAVENLKAAGMPDLAHAAAERAEQLQHQLREARERREQKALENMRNEIRELREELKSIRTLLDGKHGRQTPTLGSPTSPTNRGDDAFIKPTSKPAPAEPFETDR